MPCSVDHFFQGDHLPGEVGEFQSGQGENEKKSGEVKSGVFFKV